MVQCINSPIGWKIQKYPVKAGHSKARVIANKKTQSETEALEPQQNLIQLQKFKSRWLTADHDFYR